MRPTPGPLTRGLAAVAGVGAAVELFAFAERHPDSPLGHAVHGPGYEIQRLVSTREPSPSSSRSALRPSMKFYGPRTRLPIGLEVTAFLGVDNYEEFLNNVLIPWSPILLLSVIIYFMWRTLKLMPRTKPQEISPRSRSAVHVE